MYCMLFTGVESHHLDGCQICVGIGVMHILDTTSVAPAHLQDLERFDWMVDTVRCINTVIRVRVGVRVRVRGMRDLCM